MDKDKKPITFRSPSSRAIAEIWQCIVLEDKREAEHEPILASHVHSTILKHDNFSEALSHHLADLLGSVTVSALVLREVINDAHRLSPDIVKQAAEDVAATRDRDSACSECGTPFLYYKGFHALQSYRVANYLWNSDRKELASYLQSCMSQRFGVDIHPAAKIGTGVMLDHASGIVIGETSVVGDDVSIMQSVTLGGTGKEGGDRHPKVEAGVLIGAGVKVLGNIRIGECSKIGAGSVVLKDIPAHSIAAGVPAEVLGKTCEAMPSFTMNQGIDEKDS